MGRHIAREQPSKACMATHKHGAAQAQGLAFALTLPDSRPADFVTRMQAILLNTGCFGTMPVDKVDSTMKVHVPRLELPHCWANHKQRRSMKVNELIQARCTYCNCAALYCSGMANTHLAAWQFDSVCFQPGIAPKEHLKGHEKLEAM